ncbi:MAG: ATP-binding protein [Caldilineaceae bacterium]|nr:ATP-binding protein [Caldilineaceae bacterium]
MPKRSSPKKTLRQRLLGIPLEYKILIANSLIVAAGAVAGTIITVWHTRRFPNDIHYELIFLFGAAGIILSFIVNNWVVKRALEPLDRLQRAVDEVRSDNLRIRVQLGDNSDERFDRLAATFNQMLTRLEENAANLQSLSRRLLQTQEEERHRLARDLHDEAAQALTSLLVHLRLLERAHTPEEAQKRVQELRVLTAHALEDVRRVALDLRPTILDDLGLGPALEWRIEEFTQGDGLAAGVEIHGLERRLPREMELVFYRVGQEALNNVVRHARAQQVTVRLIQADGQITLTVEDDGQGFDPACRHANELRGLGLMGMEERMAMIGGDLSVRTAPGKGTIITAQATIPQEDEQKEDAQND